MADGKTLKTLVEAAHLPLADWPAQYPGRRAMGYLCSYVPEEMIHAAGFTPVRIRGNAAPLRHADAHLQSFTCALCRSTLDQLLGGELEHLAGTLFAHTCDALQAQADLWRMNASRTHFVDTVMQPAHLGTAAARPYLLVELQRFGQRLADFAGQPLDEADLQASIRLYNETREMIGSLQDRRDRLAVPDFYAILDAAQVMPREVFNPLLARFLEELDQGAPRGSGPALFLAGAVLDEPRLLDLIEDLGGRVTGDDLCSGSRHFYGQVGDGEPLAALTDYYLARPPCPTKYHPDHEPGAYLVEQAQAAGADGVVFIVEKFCEPHAFDYALALPALEKASLPHLMLEMEQTPSLEALRTRLQAFVEML